MSTHTNAHLSLWHGADPAAVGRYMRRVVRRLQPSVVTTTESNRAMLREVRDRLPDGYRATRRGEFLLVWDNRVLRMSHAGLYLMTALAYFTGRGGRRHFQVAAWTLRERGTRRRWRVMAGHAPASVQRGTRWRGGRRTDASRDGFHTWGRRVRRWSRRRRHGVQVLHLDSNLDQRRKGWRRYLDHELGATSVWHGNVPNRGTLGRRLVDTAHVDGLEVLDAWVLGVRPPRRVDHRGMAYRVATS